MKDYKLKIVVWWEEDMGMWAAKAYNKEGSVMEYGRTFEEVWASIAFAVEDQFNLFEGESAVYAEDT